MDEDDYLPSPRRVVSRHNNVDGVSPYYTVTGGDRSVSVGDLSSIGSESGEVLHPPTKEHDLPTSYLKNNKADEDSVHRGMALNILFGSLKLSKTKRDNGPSAPLEGVGGGGSASRLSSASDTKGRSTTTTSQPTPSHQSKMTSPQISQLEARLKELRASSTRTKSGDVDKVGGVVQMTSSSTRFTDTSPPQAAPSNTISLLNSSSDDDESPPPPEEDYDDGNGDRTGSLHAQQAISRSQSNKSSIVGAVSGASTTKPQPTRTNLVDLKPVSRTTSRSSAATSLKAGKASTVAPVAGRTTSGRSITSKYPQQEGIAAADNTVITSRLASGDVIKIPSKLFPTTGSSAIGKAPSSVGGSRTVSRLNSLGEKQSAALEKARLRRVGSAATSAAADVRPTASMRSNGSSGHRSQDVDIRSISDRRRRTRDDEDGNTTSDEEDDGILSDTIVPTASSLLRALSSSVPSKKKHHQRSKSTPSKGEHNYAPTTGRHPHEEDYEDRSQSATSSQPQGHINRIAYASAEDYERGTTTDEDDGPTDDHPQTHTCESSTHNNNNKSNRLRTRRHHNNHANGFDLDSVTDSLILEDTASGNCLSKRSLNHARSITGYIPPREYLPPVFVEQYAEVIGIIDKYASMYHRQLLAERLGHEGDLRSERAWAEFSRSISKPTPPLSTFNVDDDVSAVHMPNNNIDSAASIATTIDRDGAVDSTSPERHHRHHNGHNGGGLDTGSPLRHVQAIMAADAANSQVELLRIQLKEKCHELDEKQIELEELAHWYDQSEAAAHSGLTTKMNDFTRYQRKMEDKLKVVVMQGEALLAEHQELEHILIELEERAVTAEELLGSLKEEYNDFKKSVAAIPADELEEPSSPRADVADKSVGDSSPIKPEDSPKSRVRKVKDMKRQLEVLQESLIGNGTLPSPKKLSKYEPEVLVQSLAAAHKEVAKWRAEAFGWKEHCDATEVEMVKYKTALELLAEQEQREQQHESESRRGSAMSSSRALNTSVGSTRSVEDEDRIRTMQMIHLAEEQVATRELLLREIEVENQKREMIMQGRRVIELPSQQQPSTPRSLSPTRSISFDYGRGLSSYGGLNHASISNTASALRAPSAHSVLISTPPSVLQPNYNHLLPPPRPLDQSTTRMGNITTPTSPQQRRYKDEDDIEQYAPSYSSKAFFDDPVKAMALMDEAEERERQNRALRGGGQRRMAPPASVQPKRVHFVSKNDSSSTPTMVDGLASLSEYPPGSGKSYKTFMDDFDKRQDKFDEYCKNTGMSEEEYARAVQDQEADTNKRYAVGIPKHMVPSYSHYVGSE